MKTFRDEEPQLEEDEDTTSPFPPPPLPIMRRMSKRRRSSQLELGDFHSRHHHHLDHSHEDDEDIVEVLSRLTYDELETAARASYEYVKHPSHAKRDGYAARVCRRYLESKKGNVDLATEKVKKTLQFRKDYDLEGLMTATEDNQKNNNNTGKDYASHLQKHLSEEKFYVQGYDKEGRSTLFFIPRHTRGFDKEWHLKEALYSIERAVACSKAKDQTINAVVDFSGFSVTRHSPPMDIGKEFLTTLRSHYAGQINKIFLLDCPTSFSMLWKIFSPFVGTNTRSKIEFVSGKKDKAKLADLYDLEEMPSFMCPEGENNREFDVEEYLFELRFDQAFNERTTRMNN